MTAFFLGPVTPVPVGQDRLFKHFRRYTGLSVVQPETGLAEIQPLPDPNTDGPKQSYVGGHVYRVSDQQAADLEAAGFGEGLS